MEILSSYNLIIGASLIVVLSFFFNNISKKTNIPAVLMLIVLGIFIKIGLGFFMPEVPDFAGSLEILGTVGLIMIVLEAALELELRKEKFWPIIKSMAIALIGLIGSAYIAALILYQFIPNMTMDSAWLYATPLSILSSAIIIPSVGGLTEKKKEFHIYESTFSDIMGIMMFYFFIDKLNPVEDSGLAGFAGNLVLTIFIAVVASYAIILIFQRIKSQAKLFCSLPFYCCCMPLGKKLHFIFLDHYTRFWSDNKNINLFFPGRTKIYLESERMQQIYHELHIITMETAFVVRTFFFVILVLPFYSPHYLALMSHS